MFRVLASQAVLPSFASAAASSCSLVFRLVIVIGEVVPGRRAFSTRVFRSLCASFAVRSVYMSFASVGVVRTRSRCSTPSSLAPASPTRASPVLGASLVPCSLSFVCMPSDHEMEESEYERWPMRAWECNS